MGLMFFSFLLLAVLSLPDGTVKYPSARVLLPVEVLGEEGTVIDRSLYVPHEKSESVRFLWLRVHGLRYAAQASVQINGGSWILLRNETVDVAEPAKSFGGIGGGFATLELSLPISTSIVNAGVNIVRFRFNHSDGLASGYRILALNFLTADGSKILPSTDFAEDAPESWKPPHPDEASIRAGQELWLNAPLVANSVPHSPRIQARCADCHAHDGRDLKYFNFSNDSIITRSRFHGLTTLQGEQIASYIRSLPFTNPGRPWNPPYQPGPGLDAKPILDWAAGAGLPWVLDNDVKGLPFLLDARRQKSATPGSVDESDSRSLVGQITSNVFHPDGDLNPREIPIALQLPDWSQWLPRVHPKDAWGAEFTESEFAAQYDDDVGRAKKTRRMPSLRKLLLGGASRDEVPSIESAFGGWSRARRAFLGRYVKTKVGWPPELVEKVYSAQLWQLMKTWEMMQEFQLEAKGSQFEGHGEELRIWCNTIPAETAPAAAHIPNGPNGVGGTALTNEYLSASWYELQIILNSGRHRHHDHYPVDWVYVIGHFHDLYALSQQPEPSTSACGSHQSLPIH